MTKSKELADMSARQLRTIVAVARYENFLAAAAHLRTSQSSVSRVIKQVEAYLETPLFDRTSRRVSLTPAGREFVPVAERVLEDLQIGIDNLRQTAEGFRGRLYVSCLVSLSYDVVPAAIAHLRQTSPYVEVQILQRLQSQVLDDVRSGAADLGIANVTETDDRMDNITIGEDRLCVMLPRDHGLASRESIEFRHLASERLISLSSAANTRKMLDGVALSKGINLDHSIVLDQVALVARFVRRGLGISVVPVTMQSADCDPSITFVPLKKPQFKTKNAAFFLKHRGISTTAKLFVDALRTACDRNRANTA